MTVNMENPGIQNAIALAVVECLTRPDYGMDWVKEIVEDYVDGEVTDEIVEAVDEQIMAILKQIAIPFIGTLPAEIQGIYLK